MNQAPISPGRRIVRYGYEGGLDLDHGYRPNKHASVSRSNQKRILSKRQRIESKQSISEQTHPIP